MGPGRGRGTEQDNYKPEQLWSDVECSKATVTKNPYKKHEKGTIDSEYLYVFLSLWHWTKVLKYLAMKFVS